jgi:hypothetical protein
MKKSAIEPTAVQRAVAKLHLCECGCGRPTSIATKTNPKLGHVKGRPKKYARNHRPKVDPDHEKTRIRGEQERQEGLSEADAAARWLEDSASLLADAAPWRTKPVSSAQARLLRDLGLNPFRYKNSGEASAAISNAKKRR